MVHSLSTFTGAVANRPLTSVLGTLGWMVVLWMVRMLFTGRLITGREADERDKRYAEKVEECRQLRSTLEGMTDAVETSNAMMTALMEATHAREPAPTPLRRRTTTAREGTGQGAT